MGKTRKETISWLLLAIALLVPTIALPEKVEARESIVQNSNPEAAEQLFQEGVQLFQQGTRESLRAALVKFERSLSLWRAIADRQGEAIALLGIGRVYAQLRDVSQALDYLDRALSLLQETGDRTGEAITLSNIGKLYETSGENQQALTYYNRALPIFQEVGYRLQEAITLNNIGKLYSDRGERQTALNYYERALPILRSVGDPLEIATTLNNIGNVYDGWGQKQQALNYYNQSLALYRDVGDIRGEALSLNNIGLVYDALGERQTALEYYKRSLSLAEKIGNASISGTTLNNMGLVYSALGEKQTALDYYNRALPLLQAVGNRYVEATTLNNIGLIYSSLGETQTALDYYNRALPILRSLGNRPVEAVTINNIGAIYDQLGDVSRALDSYNRSLSLFREMGDIGGEATTLNNLGRVYAVSGKFQPALDAYDRSLSLARKTENPRAEAIALNNLGRVYDELGELPQALDYYNRALPLFRGAGDLEGEATTLNNIGLVSAALAEFPQALDYYRQSLRLFEKLGDRPGIARSFNNIGRVYDELGEKQNALNAYDRSLRLSQQVGDVGVEAGILNNIGLVYATLGDLQAASDYFNRALPLRTEIGDTSGEATTLYNIALIERRRGNLPTALTRIEAALEIIESLRTSVVSSELRTSYFASQQDAYEFYIDLLMQLHRQNPDRGYDRTALYASERARARSLLELLAEANADIRRGVDPQLLEQERTLEWKLDALESRRIQLLSSNPTDEQKAALRREREELFREYQNLRRQIRAKSPRYAALTQPQPLTLEEIQSRVLDGDSLLLQYSLGTERSYLWAVTKREIASYELPGRETIEKAVRTFRRTLTAPTQRIRLQRVARSAKSLSELLLEPVGDRLDSRRLIIVGDGALQYVPFAALSLPSAGEASYEPLAMHHEIVNLPSASALAILRRETASRRPASKAVIVLADPVFGPDDERVRNRQETAVSEEITVEIERFSIAAADAGIDGSRLPGTRQEAETILALIPEQERRHYFDFQASRERVMSLDFADYRIAHFATHGLANSQKPELSGLVLSLANETGNWQNGYLRLTDIFNLNLPVELVVLSACQTGLGKTIRGEGIVGLTRGFMYAGAPRVVVILWNVDDRATAELMSKFYRKMLAEQLSPIAALRAAQLELRETTEWRSPYYWAAFTFQGEWK